jgi:hypothetical protein
MPAGKKSSSNKHSKLTRQVKKAVNRKLSKVEKLHKQLELSIRDLRSSVDAGTFTNGD